MAFDNSYTAVTGATYAASDYNTYVKTNLTEIWKGTTAGDMDYYTSATAKSRLAIGTAYQVLRSTGSAPAWVDISTVLQYSAIVASQASGDLFYGSSATAISRLAVGGANSFLKSNGTVPSYGAVCYKRQGGSSTTWSTSGSSNYTPTTEKIQSGVVTVTITSGSGQASVTFPELYYYAPHIVMTPRLLGASARISAPTIYSVSTTGFTVEVFYIDGGSASVDIHWTARGY